MRIGVVVIVRLKTIEDGAIRRTTDDCFKKFENREVRRRILRIRCCGKCPSSPEVGHVPLRKVIVIIMAIFGDAIFGWSHVNVSHIHAVVVLSEQLRVLRVYPLKIFM